MVIQKHTLGRGRVYPPPPSFINGFIMSGFLPDCPWRHSEILKDIDQAIAQLSKGNVVAIPTETVYGLAGLGYDKTAIETIYRLKNRPQHNPLILHYATLEHTLADVVWTPWARHLAQRFWPGPLTFVLALAQGTQIPSCATGGLNSAAIRVPSHPIIQEILKQLPCPLAAPSANLSGQLSPTTAAHVAQFLPVSVLDGGPCQYGVESTIVDGRSWPVKILRPGAISGEDISDVLLDFSSTMDKYSDIALHQKSALGSDAQDIVCPGQLTSHYAPKKPLRLDATRLEPNEGLLAFGPPLLGANPCFQLSLEKNLHQAASFLFAGLHYLDQSDCQRIAVMPIPTEGIGGAIADRLSRACVLATSCLGQ